MDSEREQASLITIVPTHTSELDEVSWLRLKITYSNSPNITFVLPEGCSTKEFSKVFPLADFRFFPTSRFESYESYNRWLLTPELYESFSNFTFTLICQSDAILIRPLSELVNPYDYVGAPWIPGWLMGWHPIRRTLTHKKGLAKRRLEVGNGGISVRRNSAFINFTSKVPRLGEWTGEDMVISYFGPRYGLKIAPKTFAENVFLETGRREVRELSEIPGLYGFHNLQMFNPLLEEHILRRNS